MKKFAIYLGGEQGSGKTFAAEFLEQQLFESGWFVKIVRFAAPIYALADQFETKLAPVVEREPLKKNGPLMQRIGDIGRELYAPEVWIDIAVKDALESVKHYAQVEALEKCQVKYCVIFEDVRKEKELDMRMKMEGEGFETLSFYFSASEEIRKARLGDKFRPDTSHNTEAELSLFRDKFDHTVNTEGAESIKNAALFQVLSSKGLIDGPTEQLINLVEEFNSRMFQWSGSTGFGANFEWVYGSSGHKLLKVRDAAPIKTLPEDLQAARLKEVQETMERLDEPAGV